LVDLHSTCGTFVNEVLIDPNGAGIVLRHGDVISLGPSQASTYLYYKAAPTQPQVAGKMNSSAVSWFWLADPQ
jgi:pSer/pThr/pTyr-binding forkhead associated (FHA) protein